MIRKIITWLRRSKQPNPLLQSHAEEFAYGESKHNANVLASRIVVR